MNTAQQQIARSDCGRARLVLVTEGDTSRLRAEMTIRPMTTALFRGGMEDGRHCGPQTMGPSVEGLEVWAEVIPEHGRFSASEIEAARQWFAKTFPPRPAVDRLMESENTIRDLGKRIEFLVEHEFELMNLCVPPARRAAAFNELGARLVSLRWEIEGETRHRDGLLARRQLEAEESKGAKQ
jgi:hypothetical protein